MDQAAARAAQIGTSPRLSVAHGSVEPNQKFAHDRNQDHLAWLAAPTQTIAEGLDLGVPTHGGAGGIEQNDLDAGAAGDKAAPQLPAPEPQCAAIQMVAAKRPQQPRIDRIGLGLDALNLAERLDPC